MRISTRLKDILIKDINKDHPICKAIIKLATTKKDFINEIGFLDIAIQNPTNISYITSDRKDKFKTLGQRYADPGSILFIDKNTTAVRYDREDEGIIITHTADYRADSPTMWAYSGLSPTQSKFYGEDCIESFQPIHFKKNYYFVNFLRTKYAYMSKPGKLINKLFPKNEFSNTDIETFSELIYLNSDPLVIRGLEFVELESSKINDFYHHVNYYSKNDSGTLNSSCMRHDDCNGRFGVYSENKCTMIVLMDKDSKIHGRAIVWPAISLNGKMYKFMDRVYTASHKDESVFMNYAMSQKWAIKSRQSYANKIEFLIPDNSYSEVIREFITLDNVYEGNVYPYADTFTYLSEDETKLYNHIPKDKTIVYRLENYNEGTIDSLEKMVYSTIQGNDLSNFVWSEYHNDYVDPGHCITIDGVRYIYYRSPDIVQMVNGEYTWKKNCFYSKFHKTWNLKKNCIPYRDRDGTTEYATPDYVLWSEYYNAYVPKHFDIVKTKINNIPVWNIDLIEANKWDKKNASWSKEIINEPFPKESTEQQNKEIKEPLISTASSNYLIDDFGVIYKINGYTTSSVLQSYINDINDLYTTLNIE